MSVPSTRHGAMFVLFACPHNATLSVRIVESPRHFPSPAVCVSGSALMAKRTNPPIAVPASSAKTTTKDSMGILSPCFTRPVIHNAILYCRCSGYEMTDEGDGFRVI